MEGYLVLLAIAVLVLGIPATIIIWIVNLSLASKRYKPSRAEQAYWDAMDDAGNVIAPIDMSDFH